ncbi:hypothetical protein Bbelb_014660 [Branchiostoma belcheri]|nr:hypothetical protein Bbelb_014660 [Branchiostoma belcheri]
MTGVLNRWQPHSAHTSSLSAYEGADDLHAGTRNNRAAGQQRCDTLFNGYQFKIVSAVIKQVAKLVFLRDNHGVKNSSAERPTGSSQMLATSACPDGKDLITTSAEQSVSTGRRRSLNLKTQI